MTIAIHVAQRRAASPKGPSMNWDQISGNWKQLKGNAPLSCAQWQAIEPPHQRKTP
jgi:hypothetical protein